MAFESTSGLHHVPMLHMLPRIHLDQIYSRHACSVTSSSISLPKPECSSFSILTHRVNDWQSISWPRMKAICQSHRYLGWKEDAKLASMMLILCHASGGHHGWSYKAITDANHLHLECPNLQENMTKWPIYACMLRLELCKKDVARNSA